LLARLCILAKYSATDSAPLWVIAKAILMLLAQAHIWEVNCSTNFFHASSAVGAIAILTKISLETEARKKLRTCWSLVSQSSYSRFGIRIFLSSFPSSSSCGAFFFPVMKPSRHVPHRVART
jgi:hypothetical protein